MQTLVLCLMVAVGLSTLLKLSLATPRVRWITFALCALFVGLAWPWAVEQSKTQIEAWLANPDLMRDTAVVLSIDVAFLLAYCWGSTKAPAKPYQQIYVAQNRYTVLLRKLWRGLLAIYPGLLIFPVLFSLEVSTIFFLPGVDFALVAWGLAAIVAVTFVALGFGFEFLLPERELRLELLFLLNILIAILGVIATVNGRTALEGVGSVKVLSLVADAVLYCFLCAHRLFLESPQDYFRQTLGWGSSVVASCARMLRTPSTLLQPSSHEKSAPPADGTDFRGGFSHKSVKHIL